MFYPSAHLKTLVIFVSPCIVCRYSTSIPNSSLHTLIQNCGDIRTTLALIIGYFFQRNMPTGNHLANIVAILFSQITNVTCVILSLASLLYGPSIGQGPDRFDVFSS